MSKIKLDIVTAERMVFSEEVEEVIVPGIDGELGILPYHAPLMTILSSGELQIRQEGTEVNLAVSGGFIDVRPDHIIILADSAERAEEIDISRAEEARRRAEQAKTDASSGSAEDALAAEASLKRALTRLKVARRRRERSI
ncbi:MAG: F0F1 ATP synthase subunit epsilon [Dehalococcoidia bacterium]|nr:F0F1 ATP synthase subunit epsilon [Dehalococcoidia bacterium]